MYLVMNTNIRMKPINPITRLTVGFILDTFDNLEKERNLSIYYFYT